MTQTANNYATVLLELGVTREAVDETKEILSLTQDLPKSLKSPVVSKQDKHKLIDRIFPESMKNFLRWFAITVRQISLRKFLPHMM